MIDGNACIGLTFVSDPVIDPHQHGLTLTVRGLARGVNGWVGRADAYSGQLMSFRNTGYIQPKPKKGHNCLALTYLVLNISGPCPFI